MSQALRDARRYEEQRERDIPAGNRPLFHLSPRVGWMNDPNGFSWYGGQYHLFYQYHPYDAHWGPMHWGHAVSNDLLRWRYLPAAMAPDMPYDREGCFSGTALALPDGRHLLMYTGVAESPDGDGRQVQTQNLAFGDGVDYRKFEGNPVISGTDLPEGGSPFDFRDPKVWREPDGSFRALVANDCPGKGGGQLLLYRSDDLEKWTLLSVAAENGGRLGQMWECPDLFELDGCHVLLVSAQGMLAQGLEYANGNGSLCLLGRMDAGTGRFEAQTNHAVDYGIDFYAPETILTPDGRRVMIGWMQNWDATGFHAGSTPWFGQMSLPRELSVRDGRLCQRPVRELERLRGAPSRHEGVSIENEEFSLPGVCGRTVDLEVQIEPDGAPYHRFAVRLARGDGFYTEISYRPRESVVELDRRFSGSRRATLHQRQAGIDRDGGRLRLRLILDRFSVEVFINDGVKVMSATIDTPLSARDIAFLADGKARFSATCYPLALEEA